jgi:hypothetical protein
MGKRPRTGHLISGLGDGKVHNNNIKDARTVDDLFIRRNNDHRAYVRGSRQAYAVEEVVYPSGDAAAASKGGASVTVPPTSWHYYVMALIAMMGLLVALFLHLVTDNAPNQARGKKSKSSATKHKKKNDEWSDDCATDEYKGDNEGDPSATTFGYYYPKEPEYPKHRKPSALGAAGEPNRNFYFSAEHPVISAYRSPSNSYYKQQQQQDSPQMMGSPSPARTPTNSNLEAISPFPKAKRRLSPVSSFASMADGLHHYQSDASNTSLPLPPGVTRGSQHSSTQIHFSPRNHDAETPKVRSHRRIIDDRALSSNMPVAPTLEHTAQSPHQKLQQKSSTDGDGGSKIPFIPNLVGKNLDAWSFAGPPQPISVEDLHSEMESGNIFHEPSFSSSFSNVNHSDALPSFTRPEDSTPSFAMPPKRTEEDEDDVVSDENDPRKNIVHKRKNLTQSTDTSKSLLSTIRYDELQLEEVIGGGGFGQVWRATWRSTPVAVKVLTGSAQRVNVSRGILEEFAAEINMLKGMRHPNICLYMGACLDPPNRAIVTELAANGSLWDALRLRLHAPYLPCDGKTRAAWPLKLYPEHAKPSLPPKGTWPWALVKRVASGAARGMTYLHSGSPPVLHRDLKSANLLLDESYTAKVCDFGLSRLKAQERSMTGNCGTVQWMAPEILGNQPYAEPADVFSFGIILWELLTGECPYDGMTAIQCALAVLNRDQRPPIPSWCPPALSSLISSCVKRTPSQRPTFSQVCLALESMPS